VSGGRSSDAFEIHLAAKNHSPSSYVAKSVLLSQRNVEVFRPIVVT
jgi:hypothetical protein